MLATRAHRTFAAWQAERVIGDHDRNTLRLRLDPEGEPAGLEPGMAVSRAWLFGSRTSENSKAFATRSAWPELNAIRHFDRRARNCPVKQCPLSGETRKNAA